MKKLDAFIMKALEWSTTTKGAFYFLAGLIVVANVIKPPSDVQAWLLVIVSEFYQGVALPGLGTQQKAEAEETRRLLQETHTAMMEELQLAKEERQQLTEMLKVLHEIQTNNAATNGELQYLHSTLLEELTEVRKAINSQNGGK